MENLLTLEVKKIALEKGLKMGCGLYSRLKVGDEVSDIVIQPSSSGIWFFNVPGTISKEIGNQIICFKSYDELKKELK